MKQKWMAAMLLCLALCLAACNIREAPEDTDGIVICGTEYPLDTRELTLRGVSQPELDQVARLENLTSLDIRDTGIDIDEYETLAQALPGCHILWSVPFQGGYLDSETESIVLTALSEEELALLDHLTALSQVDGTGCPDVEVLYALGQRRPECHVTYSLTVQGVECPVDAAELTLPTVNGEDMALLRRHIPGLQTLTLTDMQEDPAGLLTLMEENPDITFWWDTELMGVTVNSQATFLDFSDIVIEDPQSLEALVTRLPRLTQMDMCRCGISNEDMDAMNRRHDTIKFVWELDFGIVQYRTDITSLMPWKDDLWINSENVHLLYYLTDLECLDLGHQSVRDCGFVANMPQMRYLLLGDTQISSIEPLRGLENIVYLEIFLTNVRDYTPLLELKNLEALNLCYTYGDPDVVAQLTWVDYIRWIFDVNSAIPESRKEELRQQMPDTLLELDNNLSSTGGMWRQTKHYFDMRDMLGMYYMTG